MRTERGGLKPAAREDSGGKGVQHPTDCGFVGRLGWESKTKRLADGADSGHHGYSMCHAFEHNFFFI